MGKLAQRLADASRSGVYRVRSTEAIEEAAAVNGFSVMKLEGKLPTTLSQVVLFPRDDAALLGRLRAHAERARTRGECFFAVCVDPEEKLAALPPLYRWE